MQIVQNYSAQGEVTSVTGTETEFNNFDLGLYSNN